VGKLGIQASYINSYLIKMFSFYIFHRYFSGTWYCSTECETLAAQSIDKDKVSEYAKSVVYHGLRMKAFKSAVREGNGLAMMADWKVNLLEFPNHRHHKYLILAHNMLIGNHKYI
jgi:hypothetical protein